MRRVVAAVVVVLSLGAVAGLAGATLTLVSDSRLVSVDDGAPIRPGPGQSLFSESLVGAQGAASQQSVFGAAGISGDGATSPVAGSVVAQSILDLRFTVDAPQFFVLSGGVSGGAGATAFLADSEGIFIALGPDLAATGVFKPGVQYTLFLGLMDDAGTFHVELTVPEPRHASLALLALSLLPAAARARRARAAR